MFLSQQYFPNLLIYGGPGTGKTTTVINLIEAYQFKTIGKRNASLVIHLNASDERGIDIIRQQIHQFVQSKSLFDNNPQNIKFIILDEVDYMTKHAHQALRYLLQMNTENVRFCLICNYISRIDTELQNEFLKLHFNELPTEFVFLFLKHICTCEELVLDDDTISKIQELFKSDLRSMINFLQINQDIVHAGRLEIVHNSVLFAYLQSLRDIPMDVWTRDETAISERMNALSALSLLFNIDPKTIIKQMLLYQLNVSTEWSSEMTSRYLSFVENVVHNPQYDRGSLSVHYIIHKLHGFIHHQRA
jgi:replication factor C subunit 3/5